MEYSIIIPFFNSEEYIGDCLNSLSLLDDSNCEFIFINDCSTDNSIVFVESFSKKKKNCIILKNTTNMGPSYSRNRGIRHSKGDYIIFVDSDDVISCSFLKTVSNYKNADFVILKDTTNLSELNQCGKKIEYDHDAFLCCYKYPSLDINVQMDGPWCKVFKKKIIIDNGIFFNEDIRNGEDTLFILEYILNCKNDVVVDYTVSYYFRRDAYIKCGKPNQNIDSEIIKFFNAYIALLKKYNLDADFYKQFCNKTIDGLIYQIFERKFFNSHFKYNIIKQTILLRQLFSIGHIKKAIKIVRLKDISNKKKKLLTILLKMHIYFISAIIIRKRFTYR